MRWQLILTRKVIAGVEEPTKRLGRAILLNLIFHCKTIWGESSNLRGAMAMVPLPLFLPPLGDRVLKDNCWLFIVLLCDNHSCLCACMVVLLVLKVDKIRITSTVNYLVYKKVV